MLVFWGVPKLNLETMSFLEFPLSGLEWLDSNWEKNPAETPNWPYAAEKMNWSRFNSTHVVEKREI